MSSPSSLRDEQVAGKRSRDAKAEGKAEKKRRFLLKRSAPREGGCHHFLPRKQRFCGCSARLPSQYCSQHVPAAEAAAAGSAGRRVPCPLDPKHTVLERQLAEHLAVCNVAKLTKKQEAMPCFQRGVNDDPPQGSNPPQGSQSQGSQLACSASESEPGTLRMGDFSDAERSAMALRLPALVAAAAALAGRDLEPQVQAFEEFEDSNENDVGDEDPEDPEDPQVPERTPGKSGKSGTSGDGDEDATRAHTKGHRHRVQERAIVAQTLAALGEREGFRSNSCLVEMGAGAAGLSLAARRRVRGVRGVRGSPAAPAPSLHVLADRASGGHRADGKLVESGAAVERLRIDIRHLDLARSPLVRRFAELPAVERGNLAMIAKHLCGAATCFSLRCAAQCAAGAGLRCDAIVIALCCHQLCSWDAYVNRGFLATLGVTPRDFALIRCMSSWCVDHEPVVDVKADVELAVELAAELPAGQAAKVEPKNSGTKTVVKPPRRKEEEGAEERREGDRERFRVGRQCKHLLNVGRVLYLEKHGFEARLVSYVPAGHTLENTLLVATPVSSKSDH